MSARRDLMALACEGCACRPATWAGQCKETQEMLQDAGWRFCCHLPTANGTTIEGLARCAGAVARFGTDERVAAMLADPPVLLDRWVAVGEFGSCDHEHQRRSTLPSFTPFPCSVAQVCSPQ